MFATYRIDEQIAKGLDRKVWLPSGGSLIIDRTEAMTVVDVNTGKFTGSGGNLEETVTKNNLEAAEEIVRQLRLRDIGGIIVVDFIDMVLESNRDLVLRRLVECLGRDRTRHQVAEVTSLGLVQMTRKRIGTGLLEAFSETCDHCQGRGVIVQDTPVEPKKADDDSRRGGSSRRSRGGRGRGEGGSGGSGGGDGNGNGNGKSGPSPKDVAAMARPRRRPTRTRSRLVDEESEPEATPVEPDAAAEADSPPRTRRRSSLSRPAEPTTPGADSDRSRRRSSLSRPAEPAPDEAPEADAEPEPSRPRRPSRPRWSPGPVAAAPAARPEPARGGPVGSDPAGWPSRPAPGCVACAPRDGSGRARHGRRRSPAAPTRRADARTVEHVPIKKKGSRKR